MARYLGVIILLAGFGGITPSPGAVFTVTNLTDGGLGSFRWALEEANRSPGLDGVWFDFPGNPPFVLSLTSNLPPVEDPLIIDGASQRGYRGWPLVEIVAATNSLADEGLVFLAGGNTLRGLALGGFARAGLVLGGEGGNVVLGNRFGTDGLGLEPRPNHFGLLIENGSPANTIGLARPGEGNLLSGNEVGLAVSDSAAGGQVVQGNWIGIDATGQSPLANVVGIAWTNASFSTLGGGVPGSGNVVSGNELEGVMLVQTTGMVLQGNLIGADPLGLKAIGNGRTGLTLTDCGSVTIGGVEPNQGNVISGNRDSGVVLRGDASTDNVLQSNLIGLTLGGDRALPNQGPGLVLADGASRNTVGATQTGVLANSWDGKTSVSGNTISGNLGPGLVIRGSGTDANVVQGNRVGMTFAGGSALPNSGPGLLIAEGAAFSLIGGLEAGQGNWIAFNQGDGVLIAEGESTIGHVISRNSVYANTGLALNLQPSGELDSMPTSNDEMDADLGPNGLQNHPILETVAQTNHVTRVIGSLHAAAERSYQIDFYHGAHAGEGEVYAGWVFVDTDESGRAEFEIPLEEPLLDARWFAAAAIDLETGDTSELSPALRAEDVRSTLAIHDIVVVETERQSRLVVAVTLSAASENEVIVSFATRHDEEAEFPAQAGVDYEAVSGELKFVPGQIVGEIEVQVFADPDIEPPESFPIELSGATGARIGRGTARVTMVDLRLRQISVRDEGVGVSFMAEAGVSYRLERAGVLVRAPIWKPVVNASMRTGTGEVMEMIDGDYLGARARYYRVGVVNAPPSRR